MATAAQLRSFGRPDLAKKMVAKEAAAVTAKKAAAMKAVVAPKSVARMGGGEAAGNPALRKTIAPSNPGAVDRTPHKPVTSSTAIKPPTYPELGTVGGTARIVPEGFVPQMPRPPRNADGTDRDFSKPNPNDAPRPDTFAGGSRNFNEATGEYRNPGTIKPPTNQPEGRVFAGGSPNFNEATGKYRSTGTSTPPNATSRRGPHPNANARQHASPNARFNRGAGGLRKQGLAARKKYEADHPKPTRKTTT